MYRNNNNFQNKGRNWTQPKPCLAQQKPYWKVNNPFFKRGPPQNPFTKNQSGNSFNKTQSRNPFPTYQSKNNPFQQQPRNNPFRQQGNYQGPRPQWKGNQGGIRRN